VTVAREDSVAHGRQAGRPGPAKGRLAAWRAINQNTVRLDLSGVGVITLPSPQNLAFLGGVAAVAAFGFIDWPVAALLAAGHLLAEDHRHRLLADFGEALTEA
jgi:hypothetical protein